MGNCGNTQATKNQLLQYVGRKYPVVTLVMMITETIPCVQSVGTKLCGQWR